MATRTDVRALVAATQVEATPLVLGGVSWPLRKPSTATVNAFMARFPDAADVVAELVFAARIDGDDKEAVFTAATDHLTSLMAARGAEFCGAWLNLCLGGEPDPETERDLVQLPDEVIVPLWAAAIDVCPEGLEPFFGAMAVGAGVPPQPETAEPQADKPKAASRRRSTRSSR